MHEARQTDGAARRQDPWRIVRRWPGPEPGRGGLRGEAKLAWRLLFELAGGVERSVRITAAAVGHDQGASDRSGRRYLEALKEQGLISTPDRFKGEITIWLHDPAVVARARLAEATDEGDQGELPFPDDALPQPEELPELLPLPTRLTTAAVFLQDPPADIAQYPPPGHKHRCARAIETSNKTSNIEARALDVFMLDVPPADIAQDPPAARSAAELLGDLDPKVRREFERIEKQKPFIEAAKAADEVPMVANAIKAKIRQLPTAAEKEDQVQRLVEWMRAKVNDPKLGMLPTDQRTGLRGESMLARIAWLVANGQIPVADVDAVFRYLEAKQRSGTLVSRAGYFIGAMNAVFKKFNLSWKSPDA